MLTLTAGVARFSPPALPPAQEASGWRFDTGPSLLLFPDKYRECFAALGERIEDHVDITRVRPLFALPIRCFSSSVDAACGAQVSPAYRAHFGDGTSFDLSYDMGELKAQLEAEEPGSGGMFFDWLGRARSSLDLGVRAFIEQDSTSVLDFLNPGRVLALALKVNPLELLLSQHWQMSQYFKSNKIKALFSFQARPYRATPYAKLALTPHLNTNRSFMLG
jgi:phytoene desaturase (3,4-didehydrolycopene-forming)